LTFLHEAGLLAKYAVHYIAVFLTLLSINHAAVFLRERRLLMVLNGDQRLRTISSK